MYSGRGGNAWQALDKLGGSPLCLLRARSEARHNNPRPSRTSQIAGAVGLGDGNLTGKRETDGLLGHGHKAAIPGRVTDVTFSSGNQAFAQRTAADPEACRFVVQQQLSISLERLQEDWQASLTQRSSETRLAV